MRLNGSNIGTFLKLGQNRPFFHPLFFWKTSKQLFLKNSLWIFQILVISDSGGPISNVASNGHKKSLDFVQDHCEVNIIEISNFEIVKGVTKKRWPLTFWFISSSIFIRSEWDAYQIKPFGLTILKRIVTFSFCEYCQRYCRGKTASPKFLPAPKKGC